MSTLPPPPPDRPTEPLRTAQPVQPVYEERVLTPAVDPNIVLLRLEDAIGSLRTGLTIVGIIAVAALGVAIYGLLKEDDDNSRTSRAGLASDARVSQIDDRVDRLSRQVQTARAGGSASAALGTRIDALERTVKTLADRPATDATQAIEQLSSRIDTLSKDLEELKQAQTTVP